MNQINKVKDIIKPSISIHAETKDFLDYINKSIKKKKDRKEWFSQIDKWKND